jgi:hypothetical protein
MGLATLFDRFLWWRRRGGSPLTHLRVLLYTRQGCHLCETAWQHLQAAQRRHRFLLEKLDVDAQPEWAIRYGKLVPVVTMDDKVRFQGAVNPVLLNRLLWAESQKTRRPKAP